MVPGNENHEQLNSQSWNGLSDNLENLYISRIDQMFGSINGRRPISLKGEILLYGRTEGNVFIVEQLRRLALYGTLQQSPNGDRLGVISLAGPLTYPELALDQDPKAGAIYNLNLQLHYRALSIEGPNSLQEAIFPRVEVLTADLTWTQAGELNGQEVKLTIGLPISKLVDGWLGLVDTMTLDEAPCSFYLPGAGPSNQNQKHNSLHGCIDGSPCTQGATNFGRLLPLRFINVCGIPSSQLEQGCQKQIDGVCEVWRNKAALGPVVEPNIQPGNNLGDITPTTAQKLRSTTASHVNVYLVQGFDYDATGGGDTKDGGQASAYCMLQANLLSNPSNRYLLAHELGHVLGISHPTGSDVISYPAATATGVNVHRGERNSVMQPGINSMRNTSRNLQIFTTWPSPTATGGNMTPLNAIVSAAPWCDNFHPDP
jgi:hypothetical protein